MEIIVSKIWLIFKYIMHTIFFFSLVIKKLIIIYILYSLHFIRIFCVGIYRVI